jgi:hypothetical protein
MFFLNGGINIDGGFLCGFTLQLNTDQEYFFKTLSSYPFFPEVNQFCTVTGNLITELGEPTKSLIVRVAFELQNPLFITQVFNSSKPTIKRMGLAGLPVPWV